MATKRKQGLGRGLDILLGSDDAVAPATQGVTLLQVSDLQAGKYQPRTRMDEGALNELAGSIREQGLLQPLLVRPLPASSIKNGATARYEIIAGERRFRAAQLAGMTEVPVLVRDVDDQATAAMALIENMQREDLNPLEEAQGIERLLKEFDYTHERAAQAVGRSRSAVSNLLRLLNLAAPVQTMLMAGDIDMGHARALLAVDAATQINLANQVIARRMSVRETEKLVTRQQELDTADATETARKSPVKSRDVVRLEEELSDTLATRVTIKSNAKRSGQITIDFASYDILDTVIARLRGEEVQEEIR